MTDDSGTSPSFLSSLPNRPIVDDIVKQIDESDNPRICGAMGFPGSFLGTIETFLLDVEAKTHVIISEPNAEQWYVCKSFGTGGTSHQEMIDHASELANKWLVQSLSDHIATTEAAEQDT